MFRLLSKAVISNGAFLATRPLVGGAAITKNTFVLPPATHKIRFSSSGSDFTSNLDSDDEYLSNYPARVNPIAPTWMLPKFKGKAVVNEEIVDIGDDDYAGKWLVFFFYPLDFTFVCPTELIAFSERIKEFRDLGAEVVACSCDSHYTHLAWVKTPRKNGGIQGMNIPILADYNKTIAKSFGVLDEKSGLAYRGLFIADPNRKIRHVVVNDLPVGRSVDETLRTLKAFQFHEKHGEICPADWQEKSK